MANVRVDLDYPISDGLPLTFKAPCPCSEVEGLIVYYPAAIGSTSILSKVFTFNDAHCTDLTGVNNLFGTNAYVKVVLNTTSLVAYIQNADTNAYLEGELAKKASVEALATKAPMYTYGTDDLTAGTSELETGTLYFVYE